MAHYIEIVYKSNGKFFELHAERNDTDTSIVIDATSKSMRDEMLAQGIDVAYVCGVVGDEEFLYAGNTATMTEYIAQHAQAQE